MRSLVRGSQSRTLLSQPIADILEEIDVIVRMIPSLWVKIEFSWWQRHDAELAKLLAEREQVQMQSESRLVLLFSICHCLLVMEGL